MAPANEIASAFRGDIIDIISGTFFVVIALLAFAIAAIRRRGGVSIMVWLGLWSASFGLNELTPSASLAKAAALSLSFQAFCSIVNVATSYLTIVPAAFVFLKLTLGTFRRYLRLLVALDIAVAVAGIGSFLLTGSRHTFIVYNQLLADAGLLTMIVVLSVPSLSRRFMVLGHHRVLTIGSLIFGAEALWSNIASPLGYEVPNLANSLGFAVLLLSLAYVALDMIIGNERRLFAIDNELEIARQLQFSILPASAPELRNLRVAATYQPMTAVAGDFYDFLPIDDRRVGFLVADVSGHGVPAALIASMIKVAAQSVNGFASDPAEVMHRLGGILSTHLRGQLVSAAYLWIDTAAHCARYSAAGHPPLLRWRSTDGSLARIESNGLLFGVRSTAEYPVCDIPLAPGDRFFLCTDGVTEPENAAGEPFGDHRFEHIVRQNQALSGSELSTRLLTEIRAWQPPSQSQQDDITLVVIDVV